jgi:hypothetical protein
MVLWLLTFAISITFTIGLMGRLVAWLEHWLVVIVSREKLT